MLCFYFIKHSTGAYKRINVIDIREGELKSYNRLTEEIEIDFIEDDDKREQAEIIGYVGYFKLINGTEKTIYMSLKQIKAHERKHRKGDYMGKGWRDDFEAMCAKTVMRRLIGKWGLMSIDYQRADSQTLAAAEAIVKGSFDDEDESPSKDEAQTPPDSGEIVDAEYYNIDPETGEIFGQKSEEVSSQAQNEESLIEKHKRMTERLNGKEEENI